MNETGAACGTHGRGKKYDGAFRRKTRPEETFWWTENTTLRGILIWRMKDQLDVTCYWCRIHLRFRKGRCSTVERDVSASRGCDQSHDRMRNHSNAPSTTRWPLSKPQPMTERVNVFTTKLVTDVFYIFNSTVVDWTCYVFFSLQNAVCFIMLTCLVPVLSTFYIQDVLKLKKNNSGAKGLMYLIQMNYLMAVMDGSAVFLLSCCVHPICVLMVCYAFYITTIWEIASVHLRKLLAACESRKKNFCV